MSDGKNPTIGTITFGPGMGDGTKPYTITKVEADTPAIDVPSIMRAGGLKEGRAAAIQEAADAIMAEREKFIGEEVRHWLAFAADLVLSLDKERK